MVFVSRLSVAVAAAAVAVSASPLEARAKPVSIPLRLVSNAGSAKSVVNNGHQRLAAVNNRLASPRKSDAVASSSPVTNELVSYVAAVNIGGTTYDLIVDTGSSNTWCGAQARCEPSATGQDTGDAVQVSYGSGSFSGEEYTDSVSFAGLTVSSQSIGAATTATGFSGVDGIIGFGPVDLTQDTVENTATVPTFMDNLYQQGSIPEEVLGVYFAPHHGSVKPVANGELTLGGVDPAKYVGPLTYFPKQTTGDASYYWGIDVAAFTYNRTVVLGSSPNAIVDTGTTLIYIPTPAYDEFLSLTGGTTDPTSGLAMFNTAPTHYFGITFGSTTYTLTPAQYLVPQSQYAAFGLTNGKYYAYINDGGTGGVDTIIGQMFIQNYYSVFDTTNSQIGFAMRAPQ